MLLNNRCYNCAYIACLLLIVSLLSAIFTGYSLSLENYGFFYDGQRLAASGDTSFVFLYNTFLTENLNTSKPARNVGGKHFLAPFEFQRFGSDVSLSTQKRGVLVKRRLFLPGEAAYKQLPVIDEVIAGVTLNYWPPDDVQENTSRDINILSDGAIRFSRGVNGSILLYYNYSDSGDLPGQVPYIGVAYEYRRSNILRTLIGFPYSYIELNPVENLTLSLSYFIINTISAVTDYEIFSSSWLYAGIDWKNKRYQHTLYELGYGRLFFFENRLKAGLGTDLNDSFVLDLSGGWAFEGFYLRGSDFIFLHDRRKEFQNEPFIAIRLKGAY